MTHQCVGWQASRRKRMPRSLQKQRPINIEVHDCLYGKIELPATFSSFLQTKEFQRLRHIKLLGGAEYIYKDATHTRYQHSVGTAYIAGLLVDRLRKDGMAPIDQHDVLCIQLAALCHDMGQGPFSHVFETNVLPQIKREEIKSKDLAYKMFRKVWKELGVSERGKLNLTSRDILFIKELIESVTISRGHKHPVYKGRDASKAILYSIFSNEAGEVSACKFDYYARNCLNFGGLTAELLEKLKSLGAVFQNETEQSQFLDSVYAVWNEVRTHVVTNAYPTESVAAIEHMISDAIVWADNHLEISKRLHDLDFFSGLDDRILAVIRSMKVKNDPGIEKSNRVLNRLENGQHYVFVTEFVVKEWDDLEYVAEQIANRSLSSEVDRRFLRLGFVSGVGAKFRHLDGDEKIIQVFYTNPKDAGAVEANCTRIVNSMPSWRRLEN